MEPFTTLNVLLKDFKDIRDLWQIGLLILASVLLFLNYRHVKIKRSSSIRMVSEIGYCDEPIKESKIQQAKTIRIITVSGKKLFDDKAGGFAESLTKHRGEIQILIAKKDSSFVKSIERMEISSGARPPIGPNGQNSISKEIEDVTHSLEALANRMKQAPAPLEKPPFVQLCVGFVLKLCGRPLRPDNGPRFSIGYFDVEFRNSLILCTTPYDGGSGWLTINLPPAKAVKSVTIRCHKYPFISSKKESLWKAMDEHFDHVWKEVEAKGDVKTLLCPEDLLKPNIKQAQLAD